MGIIRLLQRMELSIRIHKYREYAYSYSKKSVEYEIRKKYEKAIRNFVEYNYLNGTINKKFKCRVFWIDGKTEDNKDLINASALKSLLFRNTYYVGLYKGILTKLVDEVSSGLKLYKPYKNIVHNDIFDLNILKLDTSIHDEKTILGIYLIFTYIFNHEIGHIICGHQELKKCPKPPPGYRRQAREYCADLYGFAASFDLGFSANAISGYMSIDYSMADTYARVCKLWWDIISEEKVLKYDGKKRTHPLSIIRYRYIVDRIRCSLNEKSCKLSALEKQCILSHCENMYNDFLAKYSNQGVIDRIRVNEEIKQIESNLGWCFDYYDKVKYFVNVYSKNTNNP